MRAALPWASALPRTSALLCSGVGVWSRRRRLLHAAFTVALLAWLLRELAWLRRWRAYWQSLRHTMRAPAITTSASVPLRLERFGSIPDATLRQVARGLLFGQEMRRSPSFTETLHRSLSYLVNRRHPSSVCLSDTQPHIERLQSGTDSERPMAELLEARDGPTANDCHVHVPLDEASAFTAGPPCWPLPWSVCALAQLARPLASATSLPAHAHGARPWRASLETSGVTILWREAGSAAPLGDGESWTTDDGTELGIEPPPPSTAPSPPLPTVGAERRQDHTPWLLLHGIGGIDRRCVEGLARRCDALRGRLLVMPVHPNWETYGTVPWLHDTFPAPQFVTTREFVRVIGAALERRSVRKVHVVAWSMGTCFATMLHEEWPSLEIGVAVYVDPAAALPLAGSAWRWLVEARARETWVEFFSRSCRFGLGRWLLLRLLGAEMPRRCRGDAARLLGAESGHPTANGRKGAEAGQAESGGALSGFTGLLVHSVDALGAGMVGIACRSDHLRVAPELHPCAHGCDLEGHLLNRHDTLLLLDRQDTFLCPLDHADYLAEACERATMRWRDGWHCGWMYGRLWIDAGEEMGKEIDAFVGGVATHVP